MKPHWKWGRRVDNDETQNDMFWNVVLCVQLNRALMPTPRDAHEKVQQPNQRIRKSQVRSCSKLSYYKLLTTSCELPKKTRQVRYQLKLYYTLNHTNHTIKSPEIICPYLLCSGASSCDVVSGLGCMGWIDQIQDTVFPIHHTSAVWGCNMRKCCTSKNQTSSMSKASHSKTVTVNWILCMTSYSFKPQQMAAAPTLQMLCSIARLQTHALLASGWQVVQRYIIFVSSSHFYYYFHPKFQAVTEKLHPGSPGSTTPTPIWRIWLWKSLHPVKLFHTKKSAASSHQDITSQALSRNFSRLAGASKTCASQTQVWEKAHQ